MAKRICCLYLLLLTFYLIPAHGQIVIEGTVQDAESKETLPSANILVEDSYRGTISNKNGAYSLAIPDSMLPATITVRYIGYQTESRVVTEHSPDRQNFSLSPAVSELEEIVVTDEDPAIRIMKQVIEKKQLFRKQLKTYRADAYTRQTLSNDTSIVSITESESELFWDYQEGHRELVKARWQTANIEADYNFAGVHYLPNFYDDNIEITGFDLVGVTHPSALNYYEFSLEGQSSLDNQMVYEIKVEPARRLQPLFEGTIYVLDEAFALLDVDLHPNEVVTFPPPIQSFDVSYRQQFNNFGRDFWLPVDVRIEGEVKISMIGLTFPLIDFRQVSRISNYKVNTPLPDSLYRSEDIIAVDTNTVAAPPDSLRGREGAIPLSVDEKEAYVTIDSTATLEEAFQPSGFLARFMENGAESGEEGGEVNPGNIPGRFTPLARYNRVDEVFAGLKYAVDLTPYLEIGARGGYSTGYKDWSYGSGISLQWLDRERVTSSLEGGYRAGTDTRYTSHIYNSYLTLLPNLLGNENYFDFYRSEGYQLSSRWEIPTKNLSFNISFNSEKHSSLQTTTAYDLLGLDDNYRYNPPIDQGLMRSINWEAGYNLEEGYNFGVTGQRYVRLYIEHSSGALGSDFDFTRYETRLSWSLPTFYKRRLMPNTLDVGIKAGTYSGDLPLQKPGIIDGALGILSPYGILRAARNRPYEGKQFLAVQMEHNFRTIPFEAAGLHFLTERNLGLIIFGGAAKTWGSSHFNPSTGSAEELEVFGTNGVHWEAGASLNGILGLLRLDVATRLDEPAVLVNIGVSRYF